MKARKTPNRPIYNTHTHYEYFAEIDYHLYNFNIIVYIRTCSPQCDFSTYLDNSAGINIVIVHLLGILFLIM